MGYRHIQHLREREEIVTQLISRIKVTIAEILQTQRGLVFEALASLIIVGAMELAFAASMGGDHLVYLIMAIASFFLILVLLLAWSSARLERLQYRQDVQRQ